jgi:hypothetical protein
MSDAEKLARAVLMFYNTQEWSELHRQVWQKLTGSDEATTRVLADLARKVMQAEERK